MANPYSDIFKALKGMGIGTGKGSKQWKDSFQQALRDHNITSAEDISALRQHIEDKFNAARSGGTHEDGRFAGIMSYEELGRKIWDKGIIKQQNIKRDMSDFMSKLNSLRPSKSEQVTQNFMSKLNRFRPNDLYPSDNSLRNLSLANSKKPSIVREAAQEKERLQQRQQSQSLSTVADIVLDAREKGLFSPQQYEALRNKNPGLDTAIHKEIFSRQRSAFAARDLAMSQARESLKKGIDYGANAEKKLKTIRQEKKESKREKKESKRIAEEDRIRTALHERLRNYKNKVKGLRDQEKLQEKLITIEEEMGRDYSNRYNELDLEQRVFAENRMHSSPHMKKAFEETNEKNAREAARAQMAAEAEAVNQAAVDAYNQQRKNIETGITATNKVAEEEKDLVKEVGGLDPFFSNTQSNDFGINTGFNDSAFEDLISQNTKGMGKKNAAKHALNRIKGGYQDEVNSILADKSLTDVQRAEALAKARANAVSNAQQGGRFDDYIFGNKVHTGAIGVAALTATYGVAFGGHKSNAELYGSPF